MGRPSFSFHTSIFPLTLTQVQKKLPAEDKRLVQSNLLVGVAPELIGDTADEMMAISSGRGEHFVVQGIVRSADVSSFFSRSWGLCRN